MSTPRKGQVPITMPASKAMSTSMSGRTAHAAQRCTRMHSCVSRTSLLLRHASWLLRFGPARVPVRRPYTVRTWYSMVQAWYRILDTSRPTLYLFIGWCCCVSVVNIHTLRHWEAFRLRFKRYHPLDTDFESWEPCDAGCIRGSWKLAGCALLTRASLLGCQCLRREWMSLRRTLWMRCASFLTRVTLLRRPGTLSDPPVKQALFRKAACVFMSRHKVNNTDMLQSLSDSPRWLRHYCHMTSGERCG